MQNIDRIFIDPLFASTIPGVALAREENKNGDYIWDVRAGYEFSSHIKAGISITNLFNHEMMTRPADLRPPRLCMIQFTYKI
jgi:hypothetical protein